MNNLWILADATDGAAPEGGVITMEDTADSQTAKTVVDSNNDTSDTVQPKPPGSMLMWVMLPLLLVYMFFMFRGPKKKQQEHQKMVSSLSKNDRVRTIGGIFGTVLDVRDDEIVLKVDESTNTKMRVSPQAIATVLTDKNES